MRAVFSRVELKEPIPDEEFELGDLGERARAIEGFISIQIIQLDNELVLIIAGEDDEAIDRIRDAVGNDWMQEHVVPRAAGPPDRRVGDLVVSI